MRRRSSVRAVLAVAAAASLAALPATAPSPATGAGAADELYLVTLRTPGTATPQPGSSAPRPIRALQRLAEQDAALAAVGGPTPVYRWTTALNGFAVRLDPADAERLARVTGVLEVVPDSVRPLAGLEPAQAPALQAPAAPASGPRRGGRGVVVGVVDTGVAADSPVFALRSTGTVPPDFAGACRLGPTGGVGGAAPADGCPGKVVAARSYVAGFGSDAVLAASPLTPADSDGHGTSIASIAVGNAGVPVRVDGERVGRFGGQAPDAALAVYKACWNAPDPRDDGCSVADLVTAVDDATRDGVDVLTLALGGPGGIDVLERALLGATEAGVVVVAAAGNDGPGTAAHASPWVVTVGAARDGERRGRVVLPGGRRLAGAMFARRGVGPARIVRAADVAADGVRRRDARVCAPGSLDAAAVAGAVVVCERGRVGRVDKSRTVALADGRAMVLLNRGPGSVDADVHQVPTVHLAAAPSRRLLRWLDRVPRPRVALRPAGVAEGRERVAAFSGSGGVGTGTIKPDLVAPGTGVLAAVPERLGGWQAASGTSAATARVAGVAATLLGRGVRPTHVRSVLVTAARPLGGEPVLRAGAGLLRARDARRAGLVVVAAPTTYRSWLEGERPRLNTPTVLLAGGELATRRRLTNSSDRPITVTASTAGFRRSVTVTPSAARLRPGSSRWFRITIGPAGGRRVDDGFVVWRDERGGPGSTTRVPVVVAR